MPVDPSKFYCNCGKSFEVYDDYLHHVHSDHFTPFTFKCVICLPLPICFDYIDNLIDHLKVYHFPDDELEPISTSSVMSSRTSKEGDDNMEEKLDNGSKWDSNTSPPISSPQNESPQPKSLKLTSEEKLERKRLRQITELLSGNRYIRHEHGGYYCWICHEKCLHPQEHVITHLYKMGICVCYCLICKMGFRGRCDVFQHMRARHNSDEQHVGDRRFVYRKEIKKMFYNCFTDIFTPTPMPTRMEVMQLPLGYHGVDLCEDDHLDLSPSNDQLNGNCIVDENNNQITI